jgi:hypothetical protein
MGDAEWNGDENRRGRREPARCVTGCAAILSVMHGSSGKRLAVGADSHGFEAMRGANDNRGDSASGRAHEPGRTKRRRGLDHHCREAEPQRERLEDAAAVE